MSGLQKYQGNLPDSVFLRLPAKEQKICQCLHVFNQLRDFKLDAEQCFEWKDSITRIRPDASPEMILKAIDALLSGDVDYEPKEGIHNIFRALKRVWLNPGTGKLEILKPVY